MTKRYILFRLYYLRVTLCQSGLWLHLKEGLVLLYLLVRIKRLSYGKMTIVPVHIMVGLYCTESSYLSGHTDVVRCLQTLSDDTFVSAANDSTYRVWHIESTEALYVVQSHFEDFIFR